MKQLYSGMLFVSYGQMSNKELRIQDDLSSVFLADRSLFLKMKNKGSFII